MPKIAVKCPVCGKVKIEPSRYQHFNCCGVRWDVSTYMIAKGAGKTPTSREIRLTRSKGGEISPGQKEVLTVEKLESLFKKEGLI